MGTIKSDFYSDAHELAKLPNYVNREQALRDLVAIWKRKSPIVADVLAGRDSFEKIVEPIVKENLRIRFPYYLNGACSSEEYQRRAKEIEGRLQGVLSFEEEIILGRFPNRLCLAEPVKFPTRKACMAFLTPVLAAIAAFVFNNYREAGSGVGLSTFLGLGIIIGLLAMTQMFLVGETSYYNTRRVFASCVLARAQFLDDVLEAYHYRQ